MHFKHCFPAALLAAFLLSSPVLVRADDDSAKAAAADKSAKPADKDAEKAPPAGLRPRELST